MHIQNKLICPICKKELFKYDNRLACESNHSYDFAKSGYINLLNPGKKNNAKAGDSKEMIRARSDFFASCSYNKISERLISIIKNTPHSEIIDAGCGEGYYSINIAKEFSKSHIYGFDMSKFGVDHACKTAKLNKITNTLFAVSNIFDMPLKDESVDVIINMFAPVASDEFHRVLKKGGYLIIGASGENHLDGLKKILYDDVYLNEISEHKYQGFEPICVDNLKYSATINGNSTIKALFQMTPYYHRTSLNDKAKLDNINLLNTTIEVDFFIFKKI